MGASSGPNLSRTGIVFIVDTANPRSYPGSGAVWSDLSGNSLNATGNASYISSIGVTSGVSWSTPTTEILNTDIHSVFFMLKLNSNGTYPNGYTGGWEKIFSYNAGGGDRSPGVWRYPSERRIHWRYDPGNTGVDFGKDSSFSEFDLSTWYHIGVTKDGVTALSYVNGINVGASTVANPKTAGTAGIVINEYYTNPLNNVNYLTIYNKTLSATEVLQNYNGIKSRFGL